MKVALASNLKPLLIRAGLRVNRCTSGGVSVTIQKDFYCHLSVAGKVDFWADRKGSRYAWSTSFSNISEITAKIVPLIQKFSRSKSLPRMFKRDPNY